MIGPLIAIEATILIGIYIMSAEFDALKSQVAASTAVAQSAVDAINKLAARTAEDPAAVQALTDSLKSSSDALAAAVAASGA